MTVLKCLYYLIHIIGLFIINTSYAQSLDNEEYHYRLSLGNTPGIISEYSLGNQTFSEVEHKTNSDEEVIPNETKFPFLSSSFQFKGIDKLGMNDDYFDCLNKYWPYINLYNDLNDTLNPKFPHISCEEVYNQSSEFSVAPKTVFDFFNSDFTFISSSFQVPCWWITQVLETSHLYSGTSHLYSKNQNGEIIQVVESSDLNKKKRQVKKMKLLVFDGIWIEEVEKEKLDMYNPEYFVIQRMRAKDNKRKINNNPSKRNFKVKRKKITNYVCFNSFYKLLQIEAIKLNSSNSRLTCKAHQLSDDINLHSDTINGKFTLLNPFSEQFSEYSWLINTTKIETTWQYLAHFVSERDTAIPFFASMSFSLHSNMCTKGTKRGHASLENSSEFYVQIDINDLFRSWLEKNPPPKRRQSQLIFLLYPQPSTLSHERGYNINLLTPKNDSQVRTDDEFVKPSGEHLFKSNSLFRNEIRYKRTSKSRVKRHKDKLALHNIPTKMVTQYLKNHLPSLVIDYKMIGK